MGTCHENGYSATVEGFLIVDGLSLRLAKTNAVDFTLAEPYDLLPGTDAEMVIIIDGDRKSRRIRLPQGSPDGQHCIPYMVVTPS